MFAFMKLFEAHQQLLFQLYHIYDDGEAAAIADRVLESLTGWSRIDRVLNKTMVLSQMQEAQLSGYITKLLDHVPVQYVLGEAWFLGMKLRVDRSVLIPRPETEELVDWIIKDTINTIETKELSILDIGTGSGCIALALKKYLPEATIFACDISERAIAIAKSNAIFHQLEIQWQLYDILQPLATDNFPSFDIIVSNPPYISFKDAPTLPKNVVKHEPHLALFATDADPMQFYRAIIAFANTFLKKEGHLFFEVHELLAREVCQIINDAGYSNCDVRVDMQGKERMVKAGRGNKL